MRITVKTKDGVAILKISGHMIFDESLFRMRGHVQEALASGIRGFIVDMSEVPFVDSSGAGELITIYTSITKAQGLFAIVNPVERVRVLFERIRLTDIFKIAGSVEEAETAFRASS